MMSEDSESEQEERMDDAKINRLLKGEKLRQREDDSDSDDEE